MPDAAELDALVARSLERLERRKLDEEQRERDAALERAMRGAPVRRSVVT